MSVWSARDRPDEFELVGVGVVELGVRVGVLGREAGDVGVLLGRQERRRCVDGAEVERRPRQRLLPRRDLLQAAPVTLRRLRGRRRRRDGGRVLK